MSVVVTAIQFNHDPASKQSSGLNLRKNARESIAVPEWQRGVSFRAEDSVTAYALRETRGRNIRVRVRLASTDPGVHRAEIRAIQPPTAGVPWWLQYLLPPEFYWPAPHFFVSYFDYLNYLTYSDYYGLWQRWVTHGSNVLGEVRPRLVEFSASGDSGMVECELDNVRVSSRGVGVHDVSWLWQFRLHDGEQWRDIDTTHHRVYTVVGIPTAPWVQQPYAPENTALPWAEVLDVACAWATGATTEDDVARRLTQSTYDLGSTVLEYGCPPFEAYSNTLLDVFHCTSFLERLRGGIGNGRFVNCSDCATIVSTFSNVLGCDLWQSRMGRYVPAFDTNPILAMGSDRWQSPCGLGQGFLFHEVAWKSECTSDDEVCDASLAVDADRFPHAAPQRALLATNMRFGEPGDRQYRDRLAAPSDLLLCEPRPQERTRRRVI